MKPQSHPVSIPFSITSDAEDYLRDRLNGMPPEAHPVLVMTMCQTDGLKPTRWCYKGQSFILGDCDTTADCTEFELLGRPITIETDALKQLSGRTLGLRRVNASRGIINTPRYVLVLDSTSQSPDRCFATGVSPEQIKRALSITALTILGGFTGMGVIWLVSAGVVSLLKIPLERFSPLTFPLFVTGWILGAFISYLFFRPMFKTTGRPQFAQEQIQKKYLGYGGLALRVNYYVFLGIPILLTGIGIFILMPFAHTVGEKTGLVFSAVMVVFTPCMYFCDRLPSRLVLSLGVLGWMLTAALGYWYFTTHGP